MQDVRHLVSAEFISIYTEWRNLVPFETTHCSDVQHIKCYMKKHQKYLHSIAQIIAKIMNIRCIQRNNIYSPPNSWLQNYEICCDTVQFTLVKTVESLFMCLCYTGWLRWNYDYPIIYSTESSGTKTLGKIFGLALHRKTIIIIIPNLSPLAAPQVVIVKACGVSKDDKVGIVISSALLTD